MPAAFYDPSIPYQPYNVSYPDPALARMQALREAELLAASREMAGTTAATPAAATARPTMLGRVGKALGPAGIIGYEVVDAADTFQDQEATGLDKSAAVAKGLGRGAATFAGAGLGQIAIPVPFLGAGIGGMAGYFGGDAAINYGRRLFGSEGAPQGGGVEFAPGVAERIAQMRAAQKEPMYMLQPGAPNGPPPAALPQSAPVPQQTAAPRSAMAAPVAAATSAPPAAPSIETALGLPQEQKNAYAEKIEASLGDVNDVFKKFMESRGAPQPQGLSKGDKASLLIHFGLSMAAASSRPGASFLDGVTGGGMGALQGYEGLIHQRREDAKNRAAAERQTMSDYLDLQKMNIGSYRDLMQEQRQSEADQATVADRAAMAANRDATLAETRRANNLTAQGRAADLSERGRYHDLMAARGGGAFGGRTFDTSDNIRDWTAFYRDGMGLEAAPAYDTAQIAADAFARGERIPAGAVATGAISPNGNPLLKMPDGSIVEYVKATE